MDLEYIPVISYSIGKIFPVFNSRSGSFFPKLTIEVLPYYLRSKKIDWGQKNVFILFFPATKSNSCRVFRKKCSQVPKMTSSRDFNDFRLKIVKK